MGKYFLVGGGPAARTLGEPFMSRFVEEAGGHNANLTIITAGTADPAEVNACYWEIFSSFGITNLFSPKIFCREHAEAEWLESRIAESTAVFIAGGAQALLSERLGNTPVERGIRAVFDRGGIVSGTSSGASIFGGPMILEGGTVDRHLRHDMIEVGYGFAMLGHDIAVDTHCSSRGRVPRNVALWVENPSLQSIAIDEDTVLFVHEDGVGEVMGYNAVYILDNYEANCVHDKETESLNHLCMTNIKLHCLMRGDRYHLASRQPINQL